MREAREALITTQCPTEMPVTAPVAGTQTPQGQLHPALPARVGMYLPDAHDHSIASGADSHALWLDIQFHDALSTTGEKGNVTLAWAQCRSEAC